VEVEIAHQLARGVHAGQMTRSREPVIEHLERVAEAVPMDARALAYLHDVLEWSDASAGELQLCGLSATECSALQLLTRDGGERYETYIERIAGATGVPGRLARTIKLADLDDHLAHPGPGQAPDYAWARAMIFDSQERHRERGVLAS
jgi:hypothetical protein